MTSDLKAIAKQIQREAPFTGGPIHHFESVGRDTFITLLESGLLPSHRVLDVGCGALRNGYWLVRFLDAGCYFGIEPWAKMLNAGIRYALGDELAAAKQPTFSNNTRCDFRAFEVETRFDRVFARSVITHGGPGMVRSLMSQFSELGDDGAVMLLSYWQPDYEPDEGIAHYQAREVAAGEDLALDDWRFIPVMTYRFETLAGWAHEFGLHAAEWRERPLINQQVWLQVTRASG